MRLESLTESVSKEKFNSYYKKLLETSFPVKIPKTPKFLGSGMMGAAYDIGGGKILKITTDISEARASSVIAGKNLEGIWKVFGVYKRKQDYGLRFIVGEKLQEDKWVARTITQDIMPEFGSSSIEFTEKWYKECVERLDEVLDDYDLGDDVKLPTLSILKGMRNLKKNGIIFEDLHSGNVMFRSWKEAVIIDLGVSETRKEGKINVFEQTKFYTRC